MNIPHNILVLKTHLSDEKRNVFVQQFKNTPSLKLNILPNDSIYNDTLYYNIKLRTDAIQYAKIMEWSSVTILYDDIELTVPVKTFELSINSILTKQFNVYIICGVIEECDLQNSLMPVTKSRDDRGFIIKSNFYNKILDTFYSMLYNIELNSNSCLNNVLYNKLQCNSKWYTSYPLMAKRKLGYIPEEEITMDYDNQYIYSNINYKLQPKRAVGVYVAMSPTNTQIEKFNAQFKSMTMMNMIHHKGKIESFPVISKIKSYIECLEMALFTKQHMICIFNDTYTHTQSIEEFDDLLYSANSLVFDVLILAGTNDNTYSSYTDSTQKYSKVFKLNWFGAFIVKYKYYSILIAKLKRSLESNIKDLTKLQFSDLQITGQWLFYNQQTGIYPVLCTELPFDCENKIPTCIVRTLSDLDRNIEFDNTVSMLSSLKVYPYQAIIGGTGGYIGRLQSHIKYLKIARTNKWDKVCILEDSIQFVESVSTIDEYIQTNKATIFDILVLATNPICLKLPKNNMCRLIEINGLWAYIISARYYNILINILKHMLQQLQNDKSVDTFNKLNMNICCNYLQEMSEMYVSVPILCKHIGKIKEI